MSCCNTITQIPKGCLTNAGGIKKMYILNHCHLVSSGTTYDADGIVTAIQTSGSTAFVEYSFNKNTSSFVESGANSQENGTSITTTTTTIALNRREQAKRNSLALITSGNPDLVLVYLDQNGLYWLGGESNGANLTTNESTSGVALADRNGYTLTFVADEPVAMREIDSAYAISILPV